MSNFDIKCAKVKERKKGVFYSFTLTADESTAFKEALKKSKSYPAELARKMVLHCLKDMGELK